MNEDTVVYDEGSAVSASLADSETTAEDVESASPVQVISVDELLDRLAVAADEQSEEAADDQTVDGEALEEDPEDTTAQDTLTVLMELREEVAAQFHPALTTNFEEYSVGEGLMLLLFLSVFSSWLVKMVKGGFSWLTW